MKLLLGIAAAAFDIIKAAAAYFERRQLMDAGRTAQRAADLEEGARLATDARLAADRLRTDPGYRAELRSKYQRDD